MRMSDWSSDVCSSDLIMTPQAGPEQEAGPPGVPNQGHLLTPYGPSLSLAELAGENGEGKEGALGGALGDTALGLFDAEGNVRSSDLLSEEGGPSAPIDIDPSSDVVSEDPVNGTIVGRSEERR